MLENLTRLLDLRCQSGDPLRCGLELQAKLAALSSEALELLIRDAGLCFQTSRLAVESGNALFRLRHSIADRRRCRNRLQDRTASQFLLPLHFHERFRGGGRFLLSLQQLFLCQRDIGIGRLQDAAVGF